MELQTKRLLLRPFTEADAADLYDYARDPRVGPRAGWTPHKSLEESREIIRTVFAAPNTFAMVEKASGRVIGSVGFVDRHQTLLPGPDDEIGYAMHPDWWGKGLMPEAVAECIRFGFEELGLQTIWCGHFDFNDQSRRVVEKSGFRYQFTGETLNEGVGEMQVELHYAITREEWGL